MADRPLGVEPAPNREFVIGVPSPEIHSRRNRFRDWWFHVKNFSFNRGSIIEVDIDDKMIEDLLQMCWIHKINDEWFMTRKGSRELNKFMKEELDRLDDQRR